MATHVTTHHPARTDLDGLAHRAAAVATTVPGAAGDTAGDTPGTDPAGGRAPRGWALAGLGAGLAGVVTVVATSSIDVVYDPAREGTVAGAGAALADHVPAMFVHHGVSTLGALLMVVFGSGLHRRLRARLADPMLAMLAFAGLAGTAVVSVLGAGLDTEYMVGLASGMTVDDVSAAHYNHWIGTIPWVWVLTGLAGLAVFGAARRGAVPRWLGVVGLVLGGLTALVGVSPLEYMAVVPGVLWTVVTSLGFAFGDRDFRSSRSTSPAAAQAAPAHRDAPSAA